MVHRLTPAFVATPTSRLAQFDMATSTSLSSVSSAGFLEPSLGFFNGIRLPSTLIAGSSVVAVFQLTQQAKDTSGLTRTEVCLLRIYHAISILSLCMSMTTISTTTTASTLLLLGSFSSDQYRDVYHFLRGELNFEFVLTRWTFLSSIVLFLAGVGSRLILELELLKPGRRKGGLLVVLAIGGFLSGIIANINQSLNCWPNLFAMTREIYQLIWERTLQRKGPLQIVSLASFIALAFFSIEFAIQSLRNKEEN